MLIIIDALNSRTFFPALESGRFPTFRKLLERGTSCRRSISIFPSLTPAATSTIVTGDAPQGHRVFGFHWYDRSADEIAYYGDDFWTVAKLGFAKFIHNCLWSLNQDRLSSKTIFSKVQ
ncbi:MAG: alkaline phosphatase family protein, partial [Candidatus Eremiobacteraeota bacterium]|nr:alkaline phosphatase family protein [Candidatus Eremiobacteraeota bacterium]